MKSNCTKITDQYNLQRFIDAQNELNTYDQALYEIKMGMKETHWIWFVFPQLQGLGCSDMCQRYGISGIEEARAYLKNKTLHDRLIEITTATINALPRFDINIQMLLGAIDAVKFRSSMTLFLAAADNANDKFFFANAIIRACEGEICNKTKQMLGIPSTSKEIQHAYATTWLKEIEEYGKEIFIEPTGCEMANYEWKSISDTADAFAYLRMANNQ